MEKKLIKPFELKKELLNLVNLKKTSTYDPEDFCSLRNREDNDLSFLTNRFNLDSDEFKINEKYKMLCLLRCKGCARCFYNQNNILNVLKLRDKILTAKTSKDVMQYISKQPWNKDFRKMTLKHYTDNVAEAHRILLGHFGRRTILSAFIWSLDIENKYNWIDINTEFVNWYNHENKEV